MKDSVTHLKERKPAVVELEYPFEFDGRQIEKLIVNRPKMKQMKKMGKDATTEDMGLLAVKVCQFVDSDSWGIPNKVVEELDGADFIAITEQLGDFLESGQRIGKL